MVMCEHVFSGYARGSGGWEDGRCCGYWHKFGFDFVTIVCIIFIIIASLHLVVDAVLYSLSDLLDFIIWYIFFIILFMLFVA